MILVQHFDATTILSYKQGLMDLLWKSVLIYSCGGTAGITATAGSGPNPSELFK